jgi:hypothetical protein
MALDVLDVLHRFQVTRLIKGHRVQLSEEGRDTLSLTPPERKGTVVKVARDGRHLWVLWDGLKVPKLVLDAYLQRVSLWAYVRDGNL